MRKHYRGGEVLFIDFAGDTVDVTDRISGEVKPAHIFVAVLGASNYTFAEAVWQEDLESWVALVVKALEFIGGVPELMVSDNAKAVVTKTDRYDPQLHHSFIELSRHYGFALLPARPRKPQDKAKVEAGVKHVYQGVLGKLERRTFFSLHELNCAIKEELAVWNQKPFQKLAGTRRQLFEEIEIPALKELPRQRFQFAQWRKSKVHIDYHIQVEKHFYSVPHALVSKEVDVRLTKGTIEIFFQGNRVASHARSIASGRFSTLEEHMPMHHRSQMEQTVERFLAEGEKIGPWTARFMQGVFTKRKHPALGYRTCQGVMRLAKKYPERIEAACEKATRVGGFAYRTLESLLIHNLDQFHRAPASEQKVLHLNIRGADYYQTTEEESQDAHTPNTGETQKPQIEWHA
jgi:transposase